LGKRRTLSQVPQSDFVPGRKNESLWDREATGGSWEGGKNWAITLKKSQGYAMDRNTEKGGKQQKKKNEK